MKQSPLWPKMLAWFLLDSRTTSGCIWLQSPTDGCEVHSARTRGNTNKLQHRKLPLDKEKKKNHHKGGQTLAQPQPHWAVESPSLERLKTHPDKVWATWSNLTCFECGGRTRWHPEVISSLKYSTIWCFILKIPLLIEDTLFSFTHHLHKSPMFTVVLK